jgi:signal transduction histidine kinase/ligand-binding sensor domain-containing protein
MLHQKYKIIFLIFLLIAINTCSYGQLTNKQYNSYTIANGLADNNIKAIVQDKYGYIWAATENGLNRFDGLTFSSFPFSKNNIPLPGNDITDIQLRDSNNLMVVTTQGLSILNLNTLKNENIIIPNGSNKYSYKVNYLRQLLINPINNDFFLTTKSGFYHFNKNNELIFRYDDYKAEESDVAMGFGTFTYWLNEENIIIRGQKGIYEYNCTKKALKKNDDNNSNFLLSKYHNQLKNGDFLVLQPAKGKFVLFYHKSDTVLYIDEVNKLATFSKIPISPVTTLFTWRSKLFKVNDTTLLITGKFNGLYNLKLNPNNGKLQLDTNVLFANKKCNTFFIDKNKKYWIGFDDELKTEKTSKINLQLNATELTIVQQNKRSDVLQLAVTNEHIYTANSISGGLYQFNKITLEYEKTIPFNFIPYGNKSLLTIEKWNNDTLLCGTDAGLYLFSQKKDKAQVVNLPKWNVAHYWVSNIFLDSKKNMWIAGSFDRGCYVWKPNTKLPQWFAVDKNTATTLKQIYHFAEDTKGNIWLAGNGAARFNVVKDKIDIVITSFTAQPNSKTAIEAIACDENGGTWMAYGTEGLLHYNITTQQKTLYTIQNGLLNNSIQHLKYYDGYIWITTKNGINKINSITKKIVTVCSLKDLNYKVISSSKLVFDSITATFFCGVGSSIFKFQPENKNYINNLPNLFVENIIFDGDSILWYPPQTINVSWSNRNISLTFNAINFEDAAYQKYSYRTINGTVSNWILLNEQRKIVFNKLNTGKTVIEIKVFSTQNEGAEKIIQFIVYVKAPFWKTIWFYLLCIFLIGAVVYNIYKYKQKQLKKIVLLKENISKDLHDEVGATLSGISMYSHLIKANIERQELVDAQKSITVIQKSATEMVTKLNDIVWLLKTTDGTLEELFTKIYEFAQEIGSTKQLKVVLEKKGNFNTIKCAVGVRKNIFLFCKEAINNAVKYSNASLLIIHILVVDGFLKISIIDDGFGFDMDEIKKGNGLSNMQKRADEINAVLNINTKPWGGCTISLKIKITQ